MQGQERKKVEWAVKEKINEGNRERGVILGDPRIGR